MHFSGTTVVIFTDSSSKTVPILQGFISMSFRGRRWTSLQQSSLRRRLLPTLASREVLVFYAQCTLVFGMSSA